MGQTIKGARKSTKKILANNPNHFKEMGAIGGRNSNNGGVYNNPELAAQIGKIGGSKSRRGLKLVKETRTHLYYVSKTTGERTKIRKVV